MPSLSIAEQKQREIEILRVLALGIYTKKEIMEQFHCSQHTVARLASKIGAKFTQRSGKPKEEVRYDADKVLDTNKYHPCAIPKKHWPICYHGDKCCNAYYCEAAWRAK